ncbi:hypothetical protein [Brevibacillus reuszeri]|uniref:hypothetical protein n=1 Tax=Brevibacillus reuszeri TaxID=54915 RepID=UPI0013DEDCF2|nr:hypothetical protein [Brevibacillus reuszeri]
MWSIEELEKKYKELLEDSQNVKTTSGANALAHARKNIQEMLKELGHCGFDYNQ